MPNNSGNPFQQLISSFNEAITHKEKGKFSKEDQNKIYEASKALFDSGHFLEQQQLMEIRDKVFELSGGTIHKNDAMRKLQGTSRAEALKALLNRIPT